MLFPAVCNELGLKQPVMGGWIYSSAVRLKMSVTNLELAVASVYSGSKQRKMVKDGITYYLLPSNGDNTKYHKKLEFLWQNVISDFKPNLVHLHGTELAHGLALLRGCPEVKTVVSIQGLVSIIYKYYFSGISKWQILKNITFRDVLKFDNIFQQKNKFYKRGQIEKEIISRTHHVIGRTSWDMAHCFAINPFIQYHFCNEILRDEFYKHKWSYEKCEKHSIFLSQGGYPIKGLHKVIEALPYVLKKYSDTIVYVAGEDITSNKTFKHKIKRTGYGKYIKRLIIKYNLEDKIVFKGFLNEREICNQYLQSNLFICPSSIENSPNSLGEAQLMGVPCLASYVGGVPDMMKGAEKNLYRYEETEMMADKICSIFDRNLFDNSSIAKSAYERHNRKKNVLQIIDIYNKIISD